MWTEITAIFVTSLLIELYARETILYSAVIYRHGDRTPINPYPTDPWRNESLWPVKFGELTNEGKRQHYALGQWLRKRYEYLISIEYSPSELYVRSTDVGRTLMSAQVNLAGLYPPLRSSVWNPQLLWQPIPVHTMKEKDDKTLAMKKYCFAYNYEKEKLTNSTEYKERLSKYQNLMDYLTAYTGVNVKDYESISYIYSTLLIEKLYNFTLPNWTHSVFPDKLREPACYSFRIPTATPLLARLKVGPLLKEIVSKMKQSASRDKSENTLKLSVYSAHDDTVAAVLNAMNMFDGNCPVYTATVLMELIASNNSSSSPLVRISYRNFTNINEPHVLYIPFCGKKCPLDRFMELYENLITVDWESECQKEVPNMVGSVLIVILMLGVICAGCKMYWSQSPLGSITWTVIIENKE